ncbi:tRNA pseudouridine(55) synthase TruB|uniref:tRNA pseudouridine synthase B n=1 Tax=Dendrosporobacter quercicolus TaxID=146817 RepID=A0A1G9LKF6_9FIRM|nr:tRNA pseudouridine(55) synthase TruB [Dendrosporobacter quercicolus]NSL46741.1 tRNA pseudouridine(55) synthase TruB [Dendrosporobacter quercicolus DSM 1736]SDL62376.1 tRNA pseudouridine55 synthase [Dendrosporobacter quercicolus]
MVSGFINVLKPPGMTSHDAVSFIRRTYGLKRVGHAGTLDPAAAGVLPVALGQATRLIEYTTAADKAYRAELTLGYATDTGDTTGRIISRKAVDMPAESQILNAFAALTGRIEQIPPMHSAIKIGGKKLYELARAGVTVDRQPRIVDIVKLSLLSAAKHTILFDVTCSKGTYIRTLCSDIGARLAAPAVMSLLIRTKVGPFLLADSFTVEEIAEQPAAALLPADAALGHIAVLKLSDSQSQKFLYGQTFSCPGSDQELVRVYDHNDGFLGLGKRSANLLAPVKVMSLL